MPRVAWPRVVDSGCFVVDAAAAEKDCPCVRQRSLPVRFSRRHGQAGKTKGKSSRGGVLHHGAWSADTKRLPMPPDRKHNFVHSASIASAAPVRAARMAWANLFARAVHQETRASWEN